MSTPHEQLAEQIAKNVRSDPQTFLSDWTLEVIKREAIAALHSDVEEKKTCGFKLVGEFTQTSCGFAFQTPLDPFKNNEAHWQFCPWCGHEITPL